jgi:hypothetical protein
MELITFTKFHIEDILLCSLKVIKTFKIYIFKILNMCLQNYKMRLCFCMSLTLKIDYIVQLDVEHLFGLVEHFCV